MVGGHRYTRRPHVLERHAEHLMQKLARHPFARTVAGDMSMHVVTIERAIDDTNDDLALCVSPAYGEWVQTVGGIRHTKTRRDPFDDLIAAAR